MEQYSYNHNCIQHEIITCYSKKENLDYNMDKILQNCDLYVYGYNTCKDEFWAKTKNNISFIIKTNDYKIIIISNSGTIKNHHRKFYIKMKEVIEQYEYESN